MRCAHGAEETASLWAFECGDREERSQERLTPALQSTMVVPMTTQRKSSLFESTPVRIARVAHTVRTS